MKAEKIILSFVAIFVGLIAAGIAFYLYQSTKPNTPPTTQELGTKNQTSVTQTPSDTNILTIDNPKDEAVVDKKLITISGKATKGATITVSTEDADTVVQPSDNGDFTLTQTIPDGTSQLQISAIYPNGEEKKVSKTVTYSTESF